MRDALVTVLETLRDVLTGLGPGKVFIGVPQVEQTGTAPYWVIEVGNTESEHVGPMTTEYRCELMVFRVAKPPAGKAGDEAKLSILDPLTDVRSWASDLISSGYTIEPASLDLAYDRESDERQVVASLSLLVSWQEC